MDNFTENPILNMYQLHFIVGTVCMNRNHVFYENAINIIEINVISSFHINRIGGE